MIYPVSEIFTSPQGEGLYCGTLMTFVRLAGCSVGKRFPKVYYDALPVYTEQCTLYDGRNFACDTDYRVKERLPVDDIISRIEAPHVCISGGEPLIHDLAPLVLAIQASGRHVHLETSGTIEWNMSGVWVTVSPKHRCLETMISRANEIKLLIDRDFDDMKVPIGCITHPLVYIHPVNYEHEVNGENLRLCLEWQKKYPNWRIGLQLHKAMSHYIKELVR